MNKKLAAKIRVILLVTWIVLGGALLMFIQYAKIHVDKRGMVTILVWGYLLSACIVAGVLAWMKRVFLHKET